MRAVVITPGTKDSDRVADVADPAPPSGEALVQVLGVGRTAPMTGSRPGQYGEAPGGQDPLLIGDESLARS